MKEDPRTSNPEPLSVDIVKRLNRIEGQVRGLVRMIEKGSSCEDVLTQIIAARNALDRVAVHVVGSHVEECIGGLPPAQAAARVSRIIELLTRVS